MLGCRSRRNAVECSWILQRADVSGGLTEVHRSDEAAHDLAAPCLWQFTRRKDESGYKGGTEFAAESAQ